MRQQQQHIDTCTLTLRLCPLSPHACWRIEVGPIASTFFSSILRGKYTKKPDYLEACCSSACLSPLKERFRVCESDRASTRRRDVSLYGYLSSSSRHPIREQWEQLFSAVQNERHLPVGINDGTGDHGLSR